MAGSSSVLEAAPIGKQIFAHGISQRDPTAFWLVLDTYATRLLAQALSQELLLPMVISDRLHCRSPRSSAFLACGGVLCVYGVLHWHWCFHSGLFYVGLRARGCEAP